MRRIRTRTETSLAMSEQATWCRLVRPLVGTGGFGILRAYEQSRLISKPCPDPEIGMNCFTACRRISLAPHRVSTHANSNSTILGKRGWQGVCRSARYGTAPKSSASRSRSPPAAVCPGRETLAATSRHPHPHSQSGRRAAPALVLDERSPFPIGSGKLSAVMNGNSAATSALPQGYYRGNRSTRLPRNFPDSSPK
jgi:hypothetical protein